MLKFLAFADLHYMKGMYKTPVESLERIMKRAHDENVDFVVQLGDFSNSLAGSPEIVEPYFNNPYGLPVYGIYGNHELEKPGNTMALINAHLCNRPVVFGEEEETDEAGYWYTDIGAYRLIGMDSNYMYHPEEDRWYHNSADTWPFVKGTILPNSFGASQLRWLDSVLTDTEEKGLKAIVLTHPAVSGFFKGSPDTDKVQEIFARHKGTVSMAINGHHHTDRVFVRDGTVYFDVNTVHNVYWEKQTEHHYQDTHTFVYTDYDESGKRMKTEVRPLKSLRQGKNTWFTTEPLSAVVTIADDGTVTIKGSKAEWMYGVKPPFECDEVRPEIRDRVIRFE